MTSQTVYKYRVRCQTEGKNVFTWSETEPTTCPNDENHTINTNRTAIIGSVTREFPLSDIDKNKVAVHPSYKPIGEHTTYAVWTSAGDDMSTSPAIIGNGPLAEFNMTEQTGSPFTEQYEEIKIEFDFANYGRIWIHEGYLRYEGGGPGDYMGMAVMSYATPVQTFVDKTLIIEDNWIKPVPQGSPASATHGWAGTPILIPRSYSKDGDWDYDGDTLTPNYSNTGEYKISDIERTVHSFIPKISVCGSSPYFSMTSDETTEIPTGYYIKSFAHNVSNSNWCASIIMEIYREKTIEP